MIGECKIALIVGSHINGSPGIDSGSRKGVAKRAKAVLNYSALHRIRNRCGRGGGHGVAGISIPQGF